MELKGSIVAIVTPFRGGRIDEEAFARLIEFQIENGTSAIVPCADDDLANLDIALEARRLKPGIKVVLRLFDERLAENVEHGFDIHTAFSCSALPAWPGRS